MENVGDYIAFAAVVFGSSIVSGIVGMIGGLILLSVMGLWFPPAVLIPLHGLIQLVSNGTRAVMLRRSLSWKSVWWFLPGAGIAALLGLLWIPTIPIDITNILIGAMCLLMVWLPLLLALGKRSHKVEEPETPLLAEGSTPTKDKAPGLLPKGFGLTTMALGAGSTFLSLIAGGVGPLLDAFMIDRGQTKEGLMSTKAAFQVISHGLKVIVFVLGGFMLLSWAGHLLVAIPAAIAGNRLGQAIMDKIPTRLFMVLLRILVSALAVVMIARGIMQ